MASHPAEIRRTNEPAARRGYSEACTFFPARDSDGFLYGCVDLPASGEARVGVVMVAPLGRERHRSYRETLVLARELAAGGYPVLRFDYRGEGESSGCFERSTVRSRVEDVLAAVLHLRARAGLETVALVGFHVGAVIALLAAREAGVTNLVLCDPVTNVKVFGRGLVRSNVVLQNQYFGALRHGESALREELARGGTISVYGYPLGRALLEELESLDPIPHLQAWKGRSAIVPFAQVEAPPKKDVSQWKELLGRGGPCELHPAVIGHFAWGSRVSWSHEMPAVQGALSCFLAGATGAGVAAAATPASAPTTAPPARRIIELRSPEGARMAGILTAPSGKIDRRATVIVLQAGLLNKTGVGDYFRWLGDSLSAEGYHVLRVDQTGTGDSEGEIARDVPLDSYFRRIQSGVAKRDVLEQIRWVRENLRHREIHLLGQCGGCVSALLACAQEPNDVTSLVCIAMPVLYSEALDAVREGDAALAGRRYLEKLTSLESYRRLLGGKSDYRLLRASAVAALRRARRALVARLDERFHVTRTLTRLGLRVAPDHPRFNAHVWEAFQVAMKAKKRILFLMAELDNETPEFNDELKAKVLDRVPAYSRLCEIRTLPRADHSLMFQDSRDASRERILEWLGAFAPVARSDNSDRL
ncbi:MAG: alpha/beta fold hydrolase [Deltaproteobacteria bacterium]|nr:alpha/beta fold hydrolase [Deltaproteobacteria bacterium]